MSTNVQDVPVLVLYANCPKCGWIKMFTYLYPNKKRGRMNMLETKTKACEEHTKTGCLENVSFSK